MRSWLLVALLLLGCAGPETREISLDPTPGLPAGETSNYYYTALNHYRAHDLAEATTFARYALQKWEQEQAPRSQIRLARELLAHALEDNHDSQGAQAEYQKLAAEYPKVPSYQRRVHNLSTP